jgi:hypothetical protein
VVRSPRLKLNQKNGIFRQGECCPMSNSIRKLIRFSCSSFSLFCRLFEFTGGKMVDHKLAITLLKDAAVAEVKDGKKTYNWSSPAVSASMLSFFMVFIVSGIDAVQMKLLHDASAAFSNANMQVPRMYKPGWDAITEILASATKDISDSRFFDIIDNWQNNS